MTKYEKVRSTQQPEPKVIDDFSVWIAKNIIPVQEEPTGEGSAGFTGFEYDLIQYTKDEYIMEQAERNEELNNLVNTMLGVNE